MLAEKGCAPDFTIEAMRIADLPEVLEVELESHSEPWSARSFVEEMNRMHSHLLTAREAVPEGACSSGMLLGYICFWCVSRDVEILNVAVRPSRRGLGIAKALMARALREGKRRGADVAFLEVRPGNLPARMLYERLGFRKVGERPNYYGAGAGLEPALLMELDFREFRFGADSP